MNAVHVIGVGMTRFAKSPQRSIEDLGREAVLRALADAGLDQEKTQVGEVFVGSTYGGPLLGQRILRDLGMTGIPITNVENACSSGSTALREAYWAMAAGRTETALAVGVEKLTRFGGDTPPRLIFLVGGCG